MVLISHHHSKTPDEIEAEGVVFDYVITVCGNAHEICPIFKGSAKVVMHRGFDDLPFLAKTAQDEEGTMEHYRRVRDEIKEYTLMLSVELQYN